MLRKIMGSFHWTAFNFCFVDRRFMKYVKIYRVLLGFSPGIRSVKFTTIEVGYVSASEELYMPQKITGPFPFYYLKFY